MFAQICKIHRTLPPGGILVFVTGRQEVNTLKKKLNSTFPSKPPEKKLAETKKGSVCKLLFRLVCNCTWKHVRYLSSVDPIMLKSDQVPSIFFTQTVILISSCCLSKL